MESDTESSASETSEASDTVEADLSEEFEAIHTQMTELIALQDHLLQRMSRVFHNECSELHDIIDRCHQESLADMMETGRVTLGERILRSLEG